MSVNATTTTVRIDQPIFSPTIESQRLEQTTQTFPTLNPQKIREADADVQNLASVNNKMTQVHQVDREQLLRMQACEQKPTGWVHAQDENCFVYLKETKIEHVGMIKKEIYKEAVENLPICCVDVFLVDSTKTNYFLVLRKDPPAKDLWWMPGGRLQKGETRWDCCVRKCREEIGLDVVPLANLGTFETIFPDSAWDCQTHTVNTVFLAQIALQGEKPEINKHHEKWIWQSMDSKPQDPYVLRAYSLAATCLALRKPSNIV